MENEHLGAPIDGDEPITDPTTLQSREGVRATAERSAHDSDDHCGVGTVGRSVVDVRNSDGEHLLLVHDEHGIGLLPNGTVDPGGDWATVAREAAEGYTGISVELEVVLAVGEVDHVLPDDDESHLTTHRVVFRASPTGGEIQECKRSAGNGSDQWRAGWFEALPDGVSPPPEGGPRDDLTLVFG